MQSLNVLNDDCLHILCDECSKRFENGIRFNYSSNVFKEKKMALKIRLARGGAKKRPFYRIVVAEATSPRDGRFVERVGSYNPMLASDNTERVVLNQERIQYWLSVGAQPTDRVQLFLSRANLVAEKVRAENPKKATPKKKAQERAKAEAARAEAAA